MPTFVVQWLDETPAEVIEALEAHHDDGMMTFYEAPGSQVVAIVPMREVRCVRVSRDA